MQIAFFGSSLVSAYWNGAATYYRGIIRALFERGHRVTFYEPDAFDRQAHRDLDEPDWAESVVYPATEQAVFQMLGHAAGADVVVKASGVGVFDELREREVLSLRSPTTHVVFWDVDAPATLDRVRSDLDDPFGQLIPKYDLVLTYGGGPPVVDAYRSLGARNCVPIYNAVDPATHHPVEPVERYRATLNFLGNRLPDREQRVWNFFFGAAERLPEESFILGGSGWTDWVPDLPNLRIIGHVPVPDHNAFNCSARAVLNISRESMVRYGYSPATRVFEVAGAGACLISDEWEGLERFLEPGVEVLVARDGVEVAEIIADLSPERACEIGAAARQRVLAEHTYEHRAVQLESVLEGLADRDRAITAGPVAEARP
jgi:spore maturation protein CgeB